MAALKYMRLMDIMSLLLRKRVIKKINYPVVEKNCQKNWNANMEVVYLNRNCGDISTNTPLPMAIGCILLSSLFNIIRTLYTKK